MAADKEKSKSRVGTPEQVIRASRKIRCRYGHHIYRKRPDQNVQENLELVKEVWPPIIKLAEECDVKIAIENCPMLFGEEQWPEDRT